jgi:arginase
MKIAYIGFPLALGADRKGVELAPDFFRKAGVIDMMSGIAGCYDLGNVQSAIIAEGKHAADPEVKYLDTVVDTTAQLRDKVASVIRQGYFPFVVGGDHSLGLGSGAGAAMACENLGIIWLDAHGDFNTEETSPSGNLHGMPCAALMGWCKSSMNEVAVKTVNPSNFYWVGTRDLDPGEIHMAKEHNLHIFTASDVKQRGMNAVMAEITNNLKARNINRVHLSIDIDSMDPALVCGTGTKVENGLWNGDFYTFIDKIFESKKVVSADFVEYNELLDDVNKTTATWCMEALHYLTLKIKEL